MRLWHYKLIPYLPKSQLLAQWRELNSIFAKQDKHILINYIYDYDKEYLLWYSWEVIHEMKNRGYNINTLEHMHDYFWEKTFVDCKERHYPEHNEMYLKQCFYNLQEKFARGQKDFTFEEYYALCDFCFKKEKIKRG